MTTIKQAVTSEIFIESPIAIFIITPEHEVIFWNKACEKLTGITSLEMIGTKNHWRPFYKEYRPCLVDIIIDGNYSALPELYKIYRKSGLSPEGINAEGWYEQLGAKNRYILFDAAPVYKTSGELIAAIETLQDITELKQIEIEKDKLISDLNNTILKNKSLKGFVPICSSCKNIRNNDGFWIAFEEYFYKQSDLLFSHGICPKCAQKLYPDYYNKMGF